MTAMLNRLTIQNVALIERAEIEFCRGLNILSGETGSGKSVILDSVNFVLGAKAEKSMIRYGADFCAVTAEFDLTGQSEALSEMEEMGLEADESVVIFRKFTTDGRSSVRINGSPVNAAMLRRLTAHLVDVHGQSEHFFLLKESNQLKVVDGCISGGAQTQKAKLKEAISFLKACKEKAQRIGTDEGERSRRADILSFQIREIREADIKEGEEEELLARREKMNSVEKILSGLREAEECLRSEGAGVDALRAAKKSLSPIVSFDGAYEQLENRLSDLQSEAEDVAETLAALAEEVDFDEEERQRTENRLSEIRLIRKKYGGTTEEVFAFLRAAEEEYAFLCDGAAELERLNKEIAACRKEIYGLCREISDLRKAAAKDFTGRVIDELKTLNIPSARFSAEFPDFTQEDADKATANGLDGVRFIFSANAGEPLKPLSEIISGGEMSRFMLAVKTQLSSVNGISTYIFDEIDAGISGRTARVVAEKFAEIAKTTQIVAVSHLAQIACMADREFLIEKSEENGKTLTRVTRIEEKERLFEIVRLLGGDRSTEFAEKHAAEMLESAESYKKSI